jgi:hypothetical protein
MSPQALDHAEVIETGAAAAEAMMDLLEAWCRL